MSPKQDSPNNSSAQPAPRKAPLRWVSFTIACVALVITATNLWFATQRHNTINEETLSHLIKDDTFSRYTEAQEHEQLELILHLADIAKDQTVALDLYHMALSKTKDPKEKTAIEEKISATKKHQRIPTAQKPINTTLYQQLNQLIANSSAAFKHDTTPSTISHDAPSIQPKHSAWEKTKLALSRFIHVERLPERALYDTNPAEEQLLGIRLQLQLSFAQWAVLNHDATLYQGAVLTAKQLGKHSGNANYLKQLTALPNSLPSETNSHQEATT